MKFFSLSGKEYNIDIRPSKWPKRTKEECKSLFQYSVGQIIYEIFPNNAILEEFHIPGENLYLDFYIPRAALAVEIHGKQHFEYNKFFHKNKDAFLKSRMRDNKKKEWCKLNGIELVVITDKDKDIKKKIMSYLDE